VVAKDDVAFDAGNEQDPVRVTKDYVVDDDVVVGTRIDQTDAEVVTLTRITISTRPVRTEPVAASAARQSKAAARRGAVAVIDERARVDVVVGRSACDNDPGHAVRRRGHLGHKHP